MLGCSIIKDIKERDLVLQKSTTPYDSDSLIIMQGIDDTQLIRLDYDQNRGIQASCVSG